MAQKLRLSHSNASCELSGWSTLPVVASSDMRSWAKTSKLTWEVYGDLEREEEMVCVCRYWEMVEEGWFSDSEEPSPATR